MKEPYTVKLEEGQTAICYHNKRILIRKTYDECRSIFTSCDSFVGSENDIESHIQLLGLVYARTPKASIPTVSNPSPEANMQKTEASTEAPSGNIITNTVSSVWGSIKSIFSK